MKSQADYVYRAYKKYREVTKDNTCQREIRIISKPSDEDILEIKKYKCYIEDDWIIAIEKGLVYVEKALAEERQFITSEGNTIPIEKVKKVSRESVVHLAKHSNLITHVPDDESKPVIPDSLYMVEKLSDYAVYENRFLYMLLIQLKEFISMRLDKIIKIRKRYICNFKFKNAYSSKTRNYTSEFIFNEDRSDNPYAIDDNESSDLIRRIEDIERLVVIFLKSDIMVEVSKAQMIKPPIVKTNVLKMNNNFKKSLELYDFICAYNKEGFTYEEIVKNLCPFNNDIEEEFSEVTVLISNLTAKYGNDIVKQLELVYQEDEEKLKKEEAEKLLEQIERVKRKIRESNTGYEEYILLVEKRNKYLESANEKLIICENKIVELENKILELDGQMSELNRRIKALDKIIDDKNNEILEITKENEFNINKIKEEHAKEISDLSDEYDVKLQNERIEIEKEYEIKASEKLDEIESLKSEIEKIRDENKELLAIKEDEYNRLIKEHKDHENELKNNISNLETNYKGMIADLNEVNKASTLKLNNEIQALQDKLNVCLAELHACKTQLNMEIGEDFTTREGFNQLEREFEYFYKFFKEEWKKTKKKIRKQLLWTKRQGKKDVTPGDDSKDKEEIKKDEVNEDNESKDLE